MVDSTQVLQVPYHAKIVDENGELTRPWVDFFSFIVERLEGVDATQSEQAVTLASLGLDMGHLETAAGNMDALTSTSTATDTINAWEEFRAGLSNI